MLKNFENWLLEQNYSASIPEAILDSNHIKPLKKKEI